MKKVTLSAVIMALVMMGCSESGEDNSMASMTASDVRNEQIQKNADFPFVLKKVSDPVSCGNGMTRLSCLTTYYHGSEHLSYTFWACRIWVICINYGYFVEGLSRNSSSSEG